MLSPCFYRHIRDKSDITGEWSAIRSRVQPRTNHDHARATLGRGSPVYKSVTKTVYKISDFLSWQRSGSLVLSPSFQRRSVWPLAAKSLLVDTVVRGIPVPIIFIREQTDLKSLEPIREVVDGQQRLRTLISFVDKGLIANYDSARDSFTVRKEHNSSIAGKSYSDLEATDRKAILTYEFSVHVLPSDTDDRQILQIFARMNSTGVRLNNQELRNAMYFGVFKSLAYKLAYEQLGRWRAWGVFTEDNIARMDEVETTSELMRLMLVGQQSLSQPGLNKLYGDNDERFNDEKGRFRVSCG